MKEIFQNRSLTVAARSDSEDVASRDRKGAVADAFRPGCPHCGTEMLRWATPEATSWGGAFQYVCFNDGCPYFVRGWEWMQSHYNVAASYRCRLDPLTGERGPLPVWSAAALRGNIMPEPEEGVLPCPAKLC